MKNEEIQVLPKVKEERQFLHSVIGRNASCIDHMLCRSFLFKHVTEGKIEGNFKGKKARKKI